MMVNRTKQAQRGSALLIVFVMAAIVAISLYMEMPDAAFEARRQQEDLLISRGNEYARAVKVFRRKVGHYPTAIKDLENTNRMRFLRHAYVDPFTEKADWRLLHADPNGMLVDSRVKQPLLGAGIPGINGAPNNSQSNGNQASRRAAGGVR